MELGKINFNKSWIFTQSSDKDYTKERIENGRVLDLPHDFSFEGEYSLDNISGKKGAFLPTGIAYYQKTFTVNTKKRNFLQFDGAYKDARVYINGTEVIHFPYGYLGFRVEITEYATYGENLVTVFLDDSKGESSRWYNGTGIYRNVWLIEKNTELLGEDSFVYLQSLADGNATLSLSFSKNCSARVQVELSDPSGTLLYQQTTADTELPIYVQGAQLWCVDNPALYTLTLTLLSESGDIADYQEIKTGIRTAEFTHDRGFFLNAVPMKIRGCCLHHDIGGNGSAVTYRGRREQIITLKQAGFNAIRTGHTPFEPEFYQLCDEIGMLVMDEMFDGWYQKAVDDYAGNYFDERGKADLTNLIKQHRNHPCIVIWGIGNETGDEDIHGLTQVCHKADPTRPTAGGQLLRGADITGLNGPSEAPAYIENLYAEQTGNPVLLAEYPHTYQTRGFYRTQTWWRDYNRPRFDVPDYSEKEVFDDFTPQIGKVVCYNSSYDNATCRISVKDCIRRMEDFEHVLGMFIWTGYDYLGESFGWPFRAGNYGVIDLAGFPKDHYYLYQSAWTDTPMVHVLPHWNHRGKEGVIIPVVVYSNCVAVEVFVNGISYGKQSMKNKMEALYHIPYIVGELKVVGYAQDGSVVEDIKTTEGDTAKLAILPSEKLSVDADVMGVTIKATDEQGNFCNRADDYVYFSVDGGGDYHSAENGDPFDLTHNLSSSRRFFYGLQRAYIKSNGKVQDTSLYAAAVLGRRFFEDTQTCYIDAKKYTLGSAACADFDYQIKYTLDGSDPSKDGILYTGSFVIGDTTTVRAIMISQEKTMQFEATFTKGMAETVNEEFALPCDTVLVGRWACGTQEVEFLPDGNANDYVNGEKVREISWWYEQPIDQFEADTGDLDCGELQFPFHNFKLKLMKDGTLRLKRITPNGEIIKFFVKE